MQREQRTNNTEEKEEKDTINEAKNKIKNGGPKEEIKCEDVHLTLENLKVNSKNNNYGNKKNICVDNRKNNIETKNIKAKSEEFRKLSDKKNSSQSQLSGQTYYIFVNHNNKKMLLVIIKMLPLFIMMLIKK